MRILFERRFGRLWLSLGTSWSAWGTSQVLLSWGVLTQSGSAIDLGLLFALRMLPMSVAGVPLGFIADRWGRARLLAAANIGAASTGAVLVWTATLPAIEPFLVAAAVFGLLDAARMVASQSLTYDLAGHEQALGAIAVANLLNGLGSAIGAAVGGAFLGTFGIGATALLVTIEYGIGAVPMLAWSSREQPTLLEADTKPGVPGARPWFDLKPIAVLSLIAVVVEILGFSAMTLDSVFATTVFGAGAFALGLLGAARSVGRLIGSIGLAAAADRTAASRVLAGSVLAFGIGLVGYATTSSLTIGAALIMITGVAGALVDSLLQMLLQRLVADNFRGLGMGIWVFSIGFAPIGALGLGFLASAFGPQTAQGANGLLLLLFGGLLATPSFLRLLDTSAQQALAG